jgi:hypothetical protein
LKALGNWRAKFKAEPRPPEPTLLYRRRGLSHRLNHTLGHMTYGSPEPGPIVPPAPFQRRGTTPDRCDDGATRCDLSQVARRYGIAARVLFRWKQEPIATTIAPVFVEVRTGT